MYAGTLDHRMVKLQKREVHRPSQYLMIDERWNNEREREEDRERARGRERGRAEKKKQQAQGLQRTSTWLPEESGKSSSDQSWTAGYGRDARLGLFSDSQEWLRRVSLSWNPPLDESGNGEAARLRRRQQYLTLRRRRQRSYR